MRRFGFFIMALLAAIPVLAGSSAALEVKLEGTFYYEYEVAGQGDNGFFGRHDYSITNAGQQINFWPGFHYYNNWQDGVNTRTVSGLDAAQASQYMDTLFTLSLNKAVSIQGLYHIGSWALQRNRNGALDGTAAYPGQAAIASSEYLSNSIEGVQQSFSPGYWNWLTLRARMPIGDLTVGKRPSRFGCGFLWSGDDNSSSESVSLSAPYGPFRIGLSFYPARPGNEQYYNINDKTNMREFDASHSVVYQCGNLAMGYQMTHVRRHRGGERGRQTAAPTAFGLAPDGTPVVRTAADSRDRNDLYYGVFMKYTNGRFFFNAEYDSYDRIDIFSGPATATRPRGYADREFRQWMTETGVMAGPMKVSLFYARVSGIDRQGTAVGAASVIKDNEQISANLTNGQVFKPYSYLLIDGYGSGVQTGYVDRTGFGQLTAACVYAARLDYAVAANLNLYGTFMYALRPEGGYGWGYISPCITANDAGTDRFTGQVQYNIGGLTGTSPAIPNDYLGYEYNIGMEWQLLENYLLKVRYAYWQPGDWWKFACVSKDNPAWSNGINGGGAGAVAQSAANMWGINPDRAIDPIYSLQVILAASF
jgi:hypothetical protein